MLDLMQVAVQIGDAGRREGERRGRAADATARGLTRIEEMDADRWPVQIGRIRLARTSWLVAHSQALPSERVAVPPPPESYVVVATDGSQVAPDRHEGVGGCYLLNIGRITLSYGTGTRARLESSAEVLVADDAEGDEDSSVATLRFAREMTALSEIAAEAATAGLPTVGLTDGSLIAWFLDDKQGDDPAKAEALAALLETLKATQAAGVPVAGYVSSPGSRDIVNALRITLCPDEPVDCGRCQHDKADLPCAPVQRTTDAALFDRLLTIGQRSAVFSAREQTRGFSNILSLYGADQWIAFFYLHVGAEVARIEIPAWVAADPRAVNLVAAVCFDQAVKGRGYPVALAEAHERAVVRGADRQAFLSLLQRSFVRAALPAGGSRKALAKRTRAV